MWIPARSRRNAIPWSAIKGAGIILLATAAASAEGLQPLLPCDSLYESRQFTEALACVHNAIETRAVTAGEDLVKTVTLGAILSYAVDDFESARRFFDQLLALDRDFTLDHVTVPPEVVSGFNTRKAEYQAAHPVAVLPSPPKNPWRLLPFGAGHFISGRNGRGAAYLAAAGVALAANIVFYQSRTSLELPDGSYRDPRRAAALYNGQLWSFYFGFLGFGAVSFADAWRNN